MGDGEWPCRGTVLLHLPARDVLPFAGDGTVTPVDDHTCTLESGSWFWGALAASFGNGERQEKVPDKGLVIGDRCVFGAYTTITAHDSVLIDDDVWFGQGVFVSDSSHGYQDVETPIGRQLGAHAPVRVGAGTWVGHGAMLLPGTSLGRNCVVAAGAVVRGEVPDHTIVAGVPARVVRRLEPGVGWVGSNGDVRPAYTAAETARLLAGHTD